MGKRNWNFSAGPAVLPERVLETVRENLLSYRGSGIGIMEMSHRSAAFEEIVDTAEARIRRLLSLPDEYNVIFTTGGATGQFSMVPLNLLSRDSVGNYLITGIWAEKAFEEAGKFGKAHAAASSKDKNFSYLPETFSLSERPGYLHFTSNNTEFGTQFQGVPDCGDVPLICDASSDFLHKKIDVRPYSLIYAGAQKNLGPAGVTVVIIRHDLLERVPQGLPVMLDYRTYTQHNSLYNTPPTFPIYVVGEVLKWIEDEGGLAIIEKRNREKAAVLYGALDDGPFYLPVCERNCRSLMNVVFRLPSSSLEAEFLRDAEERGMSQLQGHRSVGGIRASIYNAFPLEGARALAALMKDFSIRHG